MDAYRKVLVRLYEVTGGKDTQTVDFKDLVKNQGFLGNYEDIFQYLSVQGWIAETPKADFVRITHWGSKEAQKSPSETAETSGGDPEQKRAVRQLQTETKNFLVILEEFANDASKEKFEQIEKKIEELGSLTKKLKDLV